LEEPSTLSPSHEVERMFSKPNPIPPTEDERQCAEMTFARLTEVAYTGDSPLALTARAEMAKRSNKAARSLPWPEIAAWVGIAALVVILIAITVSVVTLR
jgi:hypothetical protein